jgi:hypothetical protein
MMTDELTYFRRIWNRLATARDESARYDAAQIAREADAEIAALRQGLPAPQIGVLPWRVGRKVGRTIYDANDVLIGTMDTPELARIVVEAVNAPAASGSTA